MKKILLFGLLLLTLPAYACRPNINNIKQGIEKTTDVQTGYVTGIRDVSYEKSLKNNGNGDTITVPGSYEMRVFITENIKGNGELNETISVGGPFCGIHYGIHEKVYLFKRLDSDLIFAMSEEDFKNIHGSVYEQLSNKAVNIDSALKTPPKLH